MATSTRFSVGQQDYIEQLNLIDDELSSVVAGGSGGSFTSTVFALKDTSDQTKMGKFNLSGITSGTTRTYTLPNGDVTLASLANNTFNTGSKQSMTHSSTTSGLRLVPAAGDPSSLSNGDIWHNSSTNELKARINGATYTLIHSGNVGSSGVTLGTISVTASGLNATSVDIATVSPGSTFQINFGTVTGITGAGFQIEDAADATKIHGYVWYPEGAGQRIPRLSGSSVDIKVNVISLVGSGTMPVIITK